MVGRAGRSYDRSYDGGGGGGPGGHEWAVRHGREAGQRHCGDDTRAGQLRSFRQGATWVPDVELRPRHSSAATYYS